MTQNKINTILRRKQFLFIPSLPWDQTTLLGYFMETIYSNLILQAYYFYNGAVLIPFISICTHHQAFAKVFRHLLQELERSDENGRAGHIRKIIHFHNAIKRSVKNILYFTYFVLPSYTHILDSIRIWFHLLFHFYLWLDTGMNVLSLFSQFFIPVGLQRRLKFTVPSSWFNSSLICWYCLCLYFNRMR